MVHQKIPYIARLKTLGKSCRSCRSLPPELTPQQAQRSVDICRQLIGNPTDDRFIRRIVTCDEKWIYYRNPDASNQWLGPRQPVKVIVNKNRFVPKVMLCVWWNFESVIHWKFFPNGHEVDVDLYSQQLERVNEILRRRYPALVNRNRVLLQQDNSRPQTARTTLTKIQELGGIQLSHPDLASSDHYPFSIHGPFLAWKKFRKH